MQESWKITGCREQPIVGNCHSPSKTPLGVVLIVHGFLGYKDYGMFPRVAASLADAGFVTHRFNLSHSGMTNKTETFERPTCSPSIRGTRRCMTWTR